MNPALCGWRGDFRAVDDLSNDCAFEAGVVLMSLSTILATDCVSGRAGGAWLKPLGKVYDPRFRRAVVWAWTSCSARSSALMTAWLAWLLKKGMTWKVYAGTMLLLTFGLPCRLGLSATDAGVAAAEPTKVSQRLARLVVQHRGQLRHEYQLAGVRRRIDDELSDPNAGADGAELRVGRGRPGGVGVP